MLVLNWENPTARPVKFPLKQPVAVRGPVEILADSAPATARVLSRATVALATPSHVARSQETGQSWFGVLAQGDTPSSKLGFAITLTGAGGKVRTSGNWSLA